MMNSLSTEHLLACSLCCEKYITRDRAAVVLPCGHTYLCEQCAKRLTKCHVCREPLFWTPPTCKPVPLGINMNAARSPQTLRYGARNRYAHSPGQQSPPHSSYTTPAVKEEPIPLPLPKNIVLMEMVEAAERQARVLQEARQKLGIEDVADDEDKIEPTLAGMTALAGACGTYAVREPMGLAVLPFDPNLQNLRKELPGEEKKTEEAKEPFTIMDRQTVQVVAEEDGVYKLARGVGYIVSSTNQLVKIGGPMEKSCRLEGMLDSVTQKQLRLQKELDQITTLASGLREHIKAEMEQPEEHPIISARKEHHMNIAANNAARRVHDDSDTMEPYNYYPATPPKNKQSLQFEASSDSTETDVGVFNRTPDRANTSARYENSPAHSCPMPMTTPDVVSSPGSLLHPFIDDHSAGLPRYRVSNDDESNDLTVGLFGCGSTLFGENLIENRTTNSALLEGTHSMVLSLDDDDETSQTSYTTARTVATSNDSNYSRSLPSRSSSFDGVNFRTGMSGHTGLNQSNRNRQSPFQNPRQIRMMSEHRGAAHVRGNPIERAGGQRWQP